jgi:hypothetical protein
MRIKIRRKWNGGERESGIEARMVHKEETHQSSV